MALFHQIKRSDENERIAKQNERISKEPKREAVLQALSKAGRKPDPNAKKLLTLRIDPDVIEYFKSTGEGWQTRINEALRKAAGL